MTTYGKTLTELSFSPEIIETIMREWESEHPGCDASTMDAQEFADRFIEKLYATAQVHVEQ